MRLCIFKVERCCLKDIGTTFFPCLCFGENAMAQRLRTVAVFLGVANLEDQPHSYSIREGDV